MPAETAIPCSRDVRDLVKAEKRGGESYNCLLEKMVSQYDPSIEIDKQSIDLPTVNSK